MSGIRLAGAFAVLAAAGLGLAWLTADPPPPPVKPLIRQPLALAETYTRIAIGSCADQTKPAPIWDRIRDEAPELFIAMGDNVYGDASGSDPSLPELKAAYQALAGDRRFRRFHRNVPVLPIWDDHDYGRNDAGADFPFKVESKALFLKFWGISPEAARYGRDGLYDAVIIGPPGRRIQVILLDTRWFRSPWKPTDKRGAPGKERYVPDPDPEKTMLGEDQWDWLEAELKKDAELRLIVSSIQVESDGHGFERWGNFPAERARLVGLIEHSKAKGVIFLSGDRHAGGLYRMAKGAPYPLYEITSSALNRPYPVKDLPEPARLGELYTGENYGLVTIDWRLRTVLLELKDVKGERVMAASVPLAALSPPPPGPSFVLDGPP